MPDERAPGPVVVDIQQPAQGNWLTELTGNVAFNKLPDGSVELRAENTAKPAWIALPLSNDRLQEIVLQLDDPQPGTGICWGGEQGKPRAGLGFFRDKRTRQLVVQQGNLGGGNQEKQADITSAPVSFCSSKPWIKLLTGCGTVRIWMSADGLHWVRACDPWMNQQGPLASVGLYCCSDKQPRSIKLQRIVVGELPAINALAPVELRRQMPTFATNVTLGGWLQAVYGSQPADVDIFAWRMALRPANVGG